MKQTFRALLVVACIVMFALAPTTSTGAADTSNFQINSFHADYYLNKDQQNRSTLRVHERIVAEFPDFDQNHGIERALPKTYNSHPLDLKILSVKNASGQAWNYTTYGSNDNEVVRIGDADRFVRGQQTYHIEYTMRDVTNTVQGIDEFFWNVNGTGWQQSFGEVTANIHIPANLTNSLLDRQPVCYTGVRGSTASQCEVEITKSDNQTVVSARTNRPLGPTQNMSVAIGFSEGTFSPYQPRQMSGMEITLLTIGGIAAIAWYLVVPIYVLIKARKYWKKYGRDTKSRATIVPQYIPQKDISVMMSDVLLRDRARSSTVSAQLIDLAVRRYIKLYQTNKKDFEIELLKPVKGLLPEEQMVLELWFSTKTPVGTRRALNDKNTELWSRVKKITTKTELLSYGQKLLHDTKKYQKKLTTWATVLLILSVVTLNILGFVAAIVVFMFSYYMPARTEKGVEARNFLHGLEMYMNVAEADRLRALQTPDTALKIDVSDKKQVVKLYERLLPYAMVFGIEKKWVNELASLYEKPPEWVSGDWTTFNSVAFISSINAVTSVSNSTFSPPASSSTSGFSGGSSGGGGGGGGGGGW